MSDTKDWTFNPFAGLLVDALTGSKLHVWGSRPGKKRLVNHDAVQKRPGAEWRTFPLVPLVDGLLSQLEELAAADLFCDPGSTAIAELVGREAAAVAPRFRTSPRTTSTPSAANSG